MRNYIIMPDAHQDMTEIFSYIASDNPVAATKLLDALFKAIEMLGTHPQAGSVKLNITDEPVRFWPVNFRYLIVYCESIPVEILRVFSTYRDIPALI